MTTTSTIPVKMLADLEVYVKRMNKTADKLGLPAVTYTTSNQRTLEREVWSDTYNKKIKETLDIVDVTVYGTVPRVEGYSVVATTDATEAGNMVYVAPGHSLPKMYRDRIECDHCRTKRQRKYTVVLQNEFTQEYIQVGFSCLKDFFPTISSIEQMISYCSSIYSRLFSGEQMSEDEMWAGGGGGAMVDDLMTVIRFTLVAISKYGWLSATRAYDEGRPTASTKHTVQEFLWMTSSQLRYLDAKEKAEYHAFIEAAHSDENKAEAERLMDFYNEHLATKEDKGDYEYNLFILSQIGYVTSKNMGFACSIVPFIQREMGKTAERKQRADHPSQHVGTIGKREVFKGLVCTWLTSFGTAYGTTTMYLFKDVDGNVFKWFATGTGHLSVGDTYNLKATVKEHVVYNGEKQTIIQRATVDK